MNTARRWVVAGLTEPTAGVVHIGGDRVLLINMANTNPKVDRAKQATQSAGVSQFSQLEVPGDAEDGRADLPTA